MAESFAELFEESQVAAKMRPGTIVKGIIVEIRADFVVVNAGLKSEGVIPLEQFRNNAGDVDVKVGDEIDVALDAVEDGYGETRLSRDKAKRAKAWEELEKACETNETVIGIISDKVKGGFTVDISTIRAFLPGSLVDVRPVRDTSYLEGKPLEFKVIKVDRRRNNVVVSRRAVVESENSAEREALLEGLNEGSTIKGSGQKPYRLRRVHRLGRDRRLAAHHGYGMAPRQTSVRSCQHRRRDRSEGVEVRSRPSACIAGLETIG